MNKKPVKHCEKATIRSAKYAVYIVWNNDGKTEKEYFETYEAAAACAYGLKMAFGEQIWVGIN